MNVSKTIRYNMWTFRVCVSDVPHRDFLEALRENGSVAYASYGLGGPDDYDISLGAHTEATGAFRPAPGLSRDRRRAGRSGPIGTRQGD